MPKSLRGRVTVSVAIAAFVALTLMTIGFNLLLRDNLRGDADRVLEARAAAAIEGVEAEAGGVKQPEGPDEGAPEAAVWIYEGSKRIEGPPTSGETDRIVDELAAKGQGFAESDADDLRLHAAVISDGGPQLGTVVVAVSVEPYEKSAENALVSSILFSLVTLALIIVITRLVVSRALKPVAEMTEEAAEWSEHDLDHRFDMGPPHDELTRLASTFDSMLDRLGANLRHEQRLTAEISHELRTPLAAIAAEAELALRRPRGDVEYRDALESIERRAGQLAEIIETILLAARSHDRVSRETAQAVEVAGRAIETFGGGRDGVELIAMDQDAVVATGLAAGSQVLLPLIDNAKKHGADPVSVTIRGDSRTVTFTVADSGPGIAPEDAERIFEPGVTGGSEGDSGLSAGLGLALARRLARALGGDVTAEPASNGGLLVATLPRARRS